MSHLNDRMLKISRLVLNFAEPFSRSLLVGPCCLSTLPLLSCKSSIEFPVSVYLFSRGIFKDDSTTCSFFGR